MQENILATFSTGPAIKDTVSNLISEILGTFVLVLTIFALGLYDLQAGIGTFAVGTLIVGIGLSLGGTTGYALNPARDLGPRICTVSCQFQTKAMETGLMLGFQLWDLLSVQPWLCLYSHFSNIENNYFDRA